MKKISFYTKEYFTFSQSQKKGIIVLIFLISITLILKIILPLTHENQPAINIKSFEKEIIAFESKFDTLRSNSQNFYTLKETSPHTSNPIYKPKKNTIIVEINSTDTIALEQLPGIGKILARRIIKYRDLLGGYAHLDQLTEVYGIKTEIAEKIQPYLKIDTSKIKKLNINTAGFKEINAHPYISFEETKVLCKVRKNSFFTSEDQLVTSKIFTVEELKKLKPYLQFGK